MKIKIVDNNFGSNDWIIVEIDGSKFAEGHNLNTTDIRSLLHKCGIEVEYVPLGDKELEDYISRH